MAACKFGALSMDPVTGLPVVDEEKCTACGLCERICPRDNIKRPEGSPVWEHRCVECLGCLHICPVKAIDYGEITKGRKRYRHKAVKSAELLRKG